MTRTHRLQDRVAVITGGAAGIGEATVRMFVAEGANVVIGDLNAPAGHALVDDLTNAGHGDQVRFQSVDVSEEDQVAALIDVAETDFGGLDIVFNNAGIGGAIGSLLELETDYWDHTFPQRGEPEHIASMVRFLASDESTFVTGTTQVVDGGYLAQGPLGVHPLPGVSYTPTYTGMNYGTTGRPNDLTRVEPQNP